MISKYNVGLKALLSEGLSEHVSYGDLVYKFKKLKGINDFSFQFRKIIIRYRRIGYYLNVMRQSACLVFNPIMVDNYAAFFNCTPRLCDGPDLKLFIGKGPEEKVPQDLFHSVYFEYEENCTHDRLLSLNYAFVS